MESGSIKTAIWCQEILPSVPTNIPLALGHFNASLFAPTLSMLNTAIIHKREEVLTGTD